MKGNGRHNFNENNGYVVLFVGTPYMDGRYTNEEDAHEIADHMESRYPHIRFEVVEIRGDFRVTDDIFWARHQDEIEQFEKDSSHIWWYRDGYKAEINSN